MKLKWKILLGIAALWIIGGIGMVLQVRLDTPDNQLTIKTIEISFLIIGGLGVVLPTYLNIWQTLENNRIIENKLEFDKLENAFRILEKWDDEALLKARRFTRAIKKERKELTPNALIEKINTEEGLEESVIMVFNYWDQVRISLEYGRANQEIIIETISNVYIDIYNRFKPWIDSRSDQFQKDTKSLHDIMSKTK